MDVVMVTSSYPKFPGDVTAPFIESIALAVAARGHRVDVVLPHHPELCRPPGEPVRFFPYTYAPREEWNLWGYAQSLQADVKVRPGMYLLAPLAALALRATMSGLLTERRYDVVHVHWVVPNAALITGLVQAHGIPFVVSLHGSDVFLAERFRPAGALARRALRAAGAVTACSEDLRVRALALGAPAARTHTVPYGVDLAAFAPRPDEAPSGRLRVLALGRLVEKKGFRHLVEAAAGVPEIEVVVAGEGDLRADLAALIARTGAPVRLVGSLDRGAVTDALSEADVVAVPSIVDRAGNVDGLPNVLLEAMAAGKAIVASRLAGIPDVLQDGVNGVLVPPGDAAALGRALRTLAADAPLRARLGAAARRVAEHSLGWDAAARRFEECYAAAAALAAR